MITMVKFPIRPDKVASVFENNTRLASDYFGLSDNSGGDSEAEHNKTKILLAYTCL